MTDRPRLHVNGRMFRLRTSYRNPLRDGDQDRPRKTKMEKRRIRKRFERLRQMKGDDVE